MRQLGTLSPIARPNESREGQKNMLRLRMPEWTGSALLLILSIGVASVMWSLEPP